MGLARVRECSKIWMKILANHLLPSLRLHDFIHATRTEHLVPAATTAAASRMPMPVAVPVPVVVLHVLHLLLLDVVLGKVVHERRNLVVEISSLLITHHRFSV